MDKRLNRLKKAMKNTTFSDVHFTNQHREEIHNKIQKQAENEEDIYIAVMQLLVKKKTGFELAKQLRARGIKKFEENEGLLYSVLHRLEQKGYLQTDWGDVEGKYYLLNKKGKKLLVKAENSHQRRILDLLWEVSVQ